jgi:hypothetical protein
MKTTYFKIIGQKTGGKLILVAAVPEDLIGEIPEIFEIQALLAPKTIFSGTYPTIRLNTDTIEDKTEEHRGKGIDGIITSAEWYIAVNETEDPLKISLENK